jgi:MFS family permease
MLIKLIHLILRPRHYWRELSFDEVAELYMSRLITVFAINIVNVFAAVYLWKLGFGLVNIGLFYMWWYAMKALVFSVPSAHYVARFGPKHAIFVANLLRIPSLIAFALVGEYGIAAIFVFGLFQQMAASLYEVAYFDDFSKVKHSDHAGKEIGYMDMIEKFARTISPLVGGLLATLISPTAAIVFAAGLFALAAWPLFRTAEPVATHVRLKLRGLPWRRIWRSYATGFADGYDFVVGGVVWTLFVSVIVLAGVGDNVYAVVGALASLGVVVASLSAYAFGQLIDKRRGAALMTVTALGKSTVHLFRPFATSVPGVAATSIASEVTTTGNLMAFMRVLFDRADTSGNRLGYLTVFRILDNLGAAAAAGIMALFIWLWGDYIGFSASFVLAAVVHLLFLLSRR